jgi:AraC-like DNA-binding protein
MLRDFIQAAWWSSSGDGRFTRERALPTGSATLVINLGEDPIRIFRDESDSAGMTFARSVVWGPTTRYAIRDTTRKGAVVGFHFRPGMAAAILGVPGSELTDRFLPLDDLWGSRARRLRERLLSIATPGQVIAAASQEIAARIHRPLLIHPAAAFALEAMAMKDPPSIGQLRDRSGYGAKRFIELFSQSVGVTPKKFARLRRFQSVLTRGRADWTQVAYEAGFADQSHLVREFRAFAGISPGQYLPLDPNRPNHVAIVDDRKNFSNLSARSASTLITCQAT